MEKLQLNQLSHLDKFSSENDLYIRCSLLVWSIVESCQDASRRMIYSSDCSYRNFLMVRSKTEHPT